MTSKFLFPAVIILSVFILSSCDFDQASSQLTDKITEIDRQDKNGLLITPTVISQATVPDTQIEQELTTGTEPNLDQELNDLERSLQE